MDLNSRRLAAAEELYKKLNICGPHHDFSVTRERGWTQGGDTYERVVEFEEEIGGGQYDGYAGKFAITFEPGTAFPRATLTELGRNLTYCVKGEALQDFLREFVPDLKSPFSTSIHVKVVRNYDADLEALSAQGAGVVTTKAMAKHMLAPFQADFGTISALSFRRNERDGTYQIEIRLPLAGFPDANMELSEFSAENLDEAVRVGEAFVARLKASLVEGTQVDFEHTTIRTPKHSYTWWDVLQAQRTYDIRNGASLNDYDANDVAAATVLQIGDHAVLEDSTGDCYVVARIDEDGLCHPIKGDLSMEDAETMLNGLAIEPEPVFQSFAA
ncbi:hypothetical protein D3C71_249960 [compost metagenome]